MVSRKKKCSCAGCNKILKPGCHGTGGDVKDMCPTCMHKWHHLARPLVQRMMHGYEDNSTRFQLIRTCAVCGHLLNIWINKTTREVPHRLWFSDEILSLEAFPEMAQYSKVEREYWECAVCVNE